MPAMVPVYLQFSRWLYSYFRKPDQPLDYVYHDQTAINYINNILGTLANPAAAAVPLQGVAADGLNVNYIPPAARNNQNLLERPCGDPGNGSQAGYNNGTTAYGQWRTALHTLFASNAQLNTAHPVFAIIDTDSAHHLSAPLVERAVTRIGANDDRAVVVINFDMHWDYGTGAAGKIGCQGWGYYVANAIPNIHTAALASAYVQLGGPAPEPSGGSSPSVDWVGGKWHQAGGAAGVQTLAGNTAKDQMNTALTEVKKVAKVGRVDAYVTVDLDLVQRSHTQYNDGKFTWDQALAGIQECLATLKTQKSHLIGFDVCGLPVWPGDSSKPWVKGTKPSKTQAITNANTQIQALWAVATAY